ncbi:hypothetical protein [Nocardia sp. NRRL S-836]|uniref:hypothetical protein n=1 Tax=Nocardia sp. NRRL S-836 TaxID=1519492 RepID=UPI0006ADD70A|nr:hypothetical protein [Nocardia sp. NRRL S-836]
MVALGDRDLTPHLSRRGDLSAEQRNSPAPQHTAACACDDEPPDPDVRLAGNPALSPADLARLTTHENPLVRWALAARPDLPRTACDRLAADPVPGVRRDLAANPCVPEDVLRSLIADPYQETRRAVAHNPAVPLDLLADAAATCRVGPTLVPRVATATAAELRLLAGSAVPAVRMLVAQREDLPRDVLDRLAADPEPAVAKGVAVVPALSAGQLWALVHRHGTPLFPRVALNPGCPPDLLHHLVTHAPAGHRTFREVATHPATSAATLLLCLRDERGRAAASHPALPVDVLLTLLADPGTAEAAAANPALPVSEMEKLLSPTT